MKITIDSDKLDALIEKYSGFNITGLSMNRTFLQDLKDLKQQSNPVYDTKVEGEWGKKTQKCLVKDKGFCFLSGMCEECKPI
jgi:hypothetical protein